MTELFQYTLFGLMLGCVYAIAAMGLVLTYTVNPTATATVTYPPESAACANPENPPGAPPAAPPTPPGGLPPTL